MSRLALAAVVAASLSSLAAARSRPVQAPDRAEVRLALADARAHNLAAFRAYVAGGVYPSNVFTAGLLNVWRDQDGHYCAAATIIRTSGQTALVEKTAEDNNFIRLADVQDGPLMDWILTSGLTQDEIVSIQKPFAPVTRRPVLAPKQPIAVDPDLRTAETARLRAKYAEIETALAASQRASLDAATDRLMQHPALASELVAQAHQSRR